MSRDRFNGCPLEDAVRHHFDVRNAAAVQKLLRDRGATLAGEGLDYVSTYCLLEFICRLCKRALVCKRAPRLHKRALLYKRALLCKRAPTI